MITILVNGKIYVGRNNFQEAILIGDGIVKKTGSNKDILNNTADKIIDLQGKTVLPGLNDSHLHITLVGQAMTSCKLNPAKSIDDVIELGKDFLDKNKDLTALAGRG